MNDFSPVAMYKVRQHYTDVFSIADPAAATREALLRREIPVHPGQSICIAVGSRGIDGIDQIAKAAVGFVRERGGRPFIIPAMGSHGGATPEGQREILSGYGITRDTMGVPIVDEMEVEEIDGGTLECRLFISRAAAHADGTILINRIKPHTDYHRPWKTRTGAGDPPVRRSRSQRTPGAGGAPYHLCR